MNVVDHSLQDKSPIDTCRDPEYRSAVVISSQEITGRELEAKMFKSTSLPLHKMQK